MPIYEFYCEVCHTVYNFFTKRIDTEKQPSCPKCGREHLVRQISIFSLSKGRKESEEDDFMGGLDESKIERAMSEMAGQMENVDENDPKAMARMIRKFYGATGLEFGGSMEEAVRRMETGEDPDQIEQDLGDVLEGEDPFSQISKKNYGSLKRKLLPPRVDKTLYDL